MDRSLLVLLAIVCLYNLPQLLTGTVQFDGLDVHYSAQHYLSDELHAGRLPFWTPYIFSGFPFLADLQVGAWYPFNWPFFAAGITPRSIGGELLLSSVVACSGAYVLARRLLGCAAGAVLAGMLYGLSGWFAAHSQHVGMVAAAAWLPWLLVCLLRLAEAPTARGLAALALVGAAVVLPGSFPIALYTFVFVAVWAAVEALARRSWVVAGRLGLGLAAAGIWGGLLAAVMILPALELVGQSVRAQLDALELPDIGYFHAGSLLTLVDPDYYGLLSGHYSGPGDSTQHYFYAGILLLPLVVLGAVSAMDRGAGVGAGGSHAGGSAVPGGSAGGDVVGVDGGGSGMSGDGSAVGGRGSGVRSSGSSPGARRVLRMAAALSLPFLWYALGPRGGLFNVVARLPGFRSVELPMHGWFLPALGLALLGGAGLTLVARRFGQRWATAAIAFVFVDVLVVNQLLNPLAYARGSFEDLYGAALAAFDTQAATAEPPVTRVYGPPLAAVAYRNHALQSRVPTTYGYNPLELTSYAAYTQAAADANPRLVSGLAANYQLQGRQLVLLPEALPPAYVARAVVALPDDAAAREQLATLDPATTTLVTGAPPTVQPDAAATVSLVSDAHDASTLHYASSTPNLIRVAIPIYPGWHATLDGRDLPLVTADAAFIGIVVPAGSGDVQLSFAPRFFWPGAAISAVALLAVLATVLRPVRLPRRRAAAPDP